MLRPETIDLIKRLTPVVAQNAETITRRFYVSKRSRGRSAPTSSTSTTLGPWGRRSS
jgi:hypothetical protein